MSLKVEQFLKEFDYLHFRDEKIQSSGYEDILSVNAAAYCDFDEDEMDCVRSLNRLHGVNLARIGWAHCASAQLLICENGLIWVNFYQLEKDGIELGQDWNEVLDMIVRHWQLYQAK